jgi:hypothetical protein
MYNNAFLPHRGSFYFGALGVRALTYILSEIFTIQDDYHTGAHI